MAVKRKRRSLWVLRIGIPVLCAALLVVCYIAGTSPVTAVSNDPVEIQIVSDVHIGYTDTDVDAHLETALDDIRAQSPDTSMLCIDGDAVNSAQQSQYDTFKSLLASRDFGISEGNLFVAMGNHEQWSSKSEKDYVTRWQRYRDNYGYEENYHDQYVGNVHLIALACDEVPSSWTHSEISDEQLAWLDSLLAQDRDAKRLAIVLDHQPVRDTVYASRAGQYGSTNGIDDSDALRAVLDKYKDVLFVSAHVHMDLTNDDVIWRKDDTSPVYTNDGALAYLREETGETGDYQGLYVYAYSDHCVVKARDFRAGTWLWDYTFPL